MLSPVCIVCENGHEGSKHKDMEDALGYLMWQKPHCSRCDSTNFKIKNI